MSLSLCSGIIFVTRVKRGYDSLTVQRLGTPEKRADRGGKAGERVSKSKERHLRKRERSVSSSGTKGSNYAGERVRHCGIYRPSAKGSRVGFRQEMLLV